MTRRERISRRQPTGCQPPWMLIQSSISERALARVMVESAARKWRSQPKLNSITAHSSDGGVVRNDAAVRRMGGDAVELRLAAPFTCRRFHHHPRQCPFADRRLDQHTRRLASGRLAPRYSFAPRHLLAQPG